MIARLVCHLVGHRWVPIWNYKRAPGISIRVCTRCKENGWLMP